MELYFAPLEGITTYTYRNLHNKMFGGCEAYFAPFITPSDNEKVSIKSLRDILPEKNENVNVIPQVLTSCAEAFLRFEEKIKELGYSEVNINLGCPSSTVVKKGRGAGFLRDLKELDEFLDEIFSKSKMKISVKTRIGFAESDEIEKLMSIYNKYPIKTLTVHPRTRMDYYSGEPDMDAFYKSYAVSKNKICYNGDIYTKDDFLKITEKFPEIFGVMIGRGAIRNPAIFREIKGGKRLETQELIDFSNELINEYLRLLGSEIYTVHKLKEIWLYFIKNFPEEKKILKAIKKSNKLSEIVRAVECLPLL